MRIGHWLRAVAVIVAALVARSAPAVDGVGGGLVGWVEDTRGAPVAGAVISIFGQGIRGRSLVTLSDSAGRFFLPSLPAGSYTLRALGEGHLPAPARRVTVLPDEDAVFTVSLTPVGEIAAAAATEGAVRESAALRELRWLLRHKRRSVLEARGPDTVPDEGTAPNRPHLLGSLDVAGTVEWVASPAGVGVRTEFLDESLPASLGLLRLQGRLAGGGTWTLGGLLSESEDTAWRTSAEFVIEPGDGHRIQAGAGYGTQLARPLVPSARRGRVDERSVGALFIQDRWQAGERLTASLGGRFSYIGFLERAHHLDPMASIEFQRDRRTRVKGAFSKRTLVPGGDLLTLSTLASPAMAFASMDEGLRPERWVRYELSVEEDFGPTELRAHTFYEDAGDQLVNTFDGSRPPRALRIRNAPGVSARGMGLSVGRRFGDFVSGSISYTYGHSSRDALAPGGDARHEILSYREAGFHDVVTRLETIIEGTDTRLLAFYRINTMSPEGESRGGNAVTSTRFDVQLSQGLPLLRALTRADWDVLLAVRNLFYETSEAGTLDELVIVNPPTRILGGISVRF